MATRDRGEECANEMKKIKNKIEEEKGEKTLYVEREINEWRCVIRKKIQGDIGINLRR